MITGGREILRDSIESFHAIINANGNVPHYIEEGGIHAGMVYVESLDYIGDAGAVKALEGDYKDKFSYNHVTEFLEKRL